MIVLLIHLQEIVPPSWTAPILIAKGMLATVGVMLLVAQMNTAWPAMKDRSQKARYLCLLGFGLLVSASTTEQLNDGIVIEWRHIGGLVMSAALAGVSLYSLLYEKKHKKGQP